MTRTTRVPCVLRQSCTPHRQPSSSPTLLRKVRGVASSHRIPELRTETDPTTRDIPKLVEEPVRAIPPVATTRDDFLGKEIEIRRFSVQNEPNAKVTEPTAKDVTEKPINSQSGSTSRKIDPPKQVDPFARYKRIKAQFEALKKTPGAGQDSSKGIETESQPAGKSLAQSPALKNIKISNGSAPSGLNVSKAGKLHGDDLPRVTESDPQPSSAKPVRIQKYVTFHEQVGARKHANIRSYLGNASHAKVPTRVATPQSVSAKPVRIQKYVTLYEQVRARKCANIPSHLETPSHAKAPMRVATSTPVKTPGRLQVRPRLVFRENRTISKRSKKLSPPPMPLTILKVPSDPSPSLLRTPGPLQIRKHLTFGEKRSHKKRFEKPSPPPTPAELLRFPFDPRPLSVDWHPGDWFCGLPSCGWHNHSTWQMCHNSTCGTPKEAAKPIHKLLKGEWVCVAISCGVYNGAERESCHRCGAGKSDQRKLKKKWPREGILGEGQWFCAVCRNRNKKEDWHCKCGSTEEWGGGVGLGACEF
ncbi:uncharacterized protein BDZ99DRAFT_107320 [Mytilinidion resinicola]|uniref:RanBP2-type domain-containing protein n=1 Tax=Mytilinidion resinicola TaxID=574789 RepID=A0A6A6Y9S2_9PEZI|nr:uncharacterized protein BDZ99DRAFT_107320 [Mytilinidion resinicola]KAF2805566.1 hypothetical protein BDZ99DRAFT_107320 [Mytilinidion resinicola]